MRVRSTIIILLAASAVASQVLAHNIDEQFDNGGRFSIDYYQITCDADTNQLYFQVADRTPNDAKVHILVRKGGRASMTADLNDSNTAPGTSRTFKMRAGVYDVFVFHSNSGNDIYRIIAHCQDAAGGHTETTTVIRQDQ